MKASSTLILISITLSISGFACLTTPNDFWGDHEVRNPPENELPRTYKNTFRTSFRQGRIDTSFPSCEGLVQDYKDELYELRYCVNNSQCSTCMGCGTTDIVAIGSDQNHLEEVLNTQLKYEGM